jgi:transposase-like protein
MLEDALAESIQAVDAVVQVDLWDLDRLAACRSCAQARRERLERQNLSGEREPRFLCSSCRRDGESG